MLFCFETFEFDTKRRELRNAGRSISLEPQVFDLLEYLIRNRDRLVSKDDIMAAVWGGRIVSESTLTSRINAARTAIGDTGAAQRLIKTMRHRGLRFVGEVRDDGSGSSSPQASPAAQALRMATGASIVVLPFVNLSGDSAQDYFADGMVEEITAAIGRLPWLFVIASSTAFSFRGQNVDARHVGAQLGVRYVLQGSVRKEQRNTRISVHLTDASSGQQLWSQRFDGEVDEIFAIQDRVAKQLSAAIAPTVRSREVEYARRKPTNNLTAYDLFLRALPPRRDNPTQNEEALRLLGKAIELDPTFSAAYGLAAWCYEIQAYFGWRPPSDARFKEGIRLARVAAETGQDDPDALWMAGLSITTLAGEVAHGAALIENSLAINPNSARAWWANGVVRTYLGDPGAALEHLARSRELNPLDTAVYAHWTAVATAHFCLARHDEALAALDKALLDWGDAPPALRLKAAICGASGQLKEGRDCVQYLLAQTPTATIESIRDRFEPLMRGNAQVLGVMLQGLRQSGLPEGAAARQGQVTKLRSV